MTKERYDMQENKETGCVKISIDEVDTEFYVKIDNKLVKRVVCYVLTALTSLLGLVGINTSLVSRNTQPPKTEVHE